MNPLFHFSSSERRGILVLLILIISTILAPSIYKVFSSSEIDVADSAFIAEVQLIQRTFEMPPKYISQSNKSRKEIRFREFDPNTECLDSMLAMGLEGRLARTIVNYRNRGGQFRKKEDIKKLYGMNDSLYLILEGFISIQHLKKPEETDKKRIDAYKIKSVETIELNSADSLTLTGLKGIGPVYASRIIKFRNKLGGFYCYAQLKEVYGLDSSILPRLSTFIRVDTSNIQKLDLNLATFSELNKHPYLEFEEVKAIINYRKKRKTKVVVRELLENKVVSLQTYVKVKNYLK